MKVRNGFISNSSSSSFIVMKGTKILIPEFPIHRIYDWEKSKEIILDRNILMIPQTFGGEVEFGRQYKNYDDFGSRLNWAYIQAKSVYDVYTTKGKGFYSGFYETVEKFCNVHKDDLKMLEDLLKKTYHVHTIECNIVDYFEKKKSNKFFTGFIDHQSLWNEKQKMYEKIFECEDTLYKWLFGEENIICNRSDEDPDETMNIEYNHCYDYVDEDVWIDHGPEPEKVWITLEHIIAAIFKYHKRNSITVGELIDFFYEMYYQLRERDELFEKYDYEFTGCDLRELAFLNNDEVFTLDDNLVITSKIELSEGPDNVQELLFKVLKYEDENKECGICIVKH